MEPKKAKGLMNIYREVLIKSKLSSAPLCLVVQSLVDVSPFIP